MSYQIDYAWVCHMGRVRANNQDNFWCCGAQLPAENTGQRGVKKDVAFLEALPAFAVFDGMGGESCGEQAAYLAAEKFGWYYNSHKREIKKDPRGFLLEACQQMNQAVCAYGRENKISSMGTTLALALFEPGGIHLCNLGDSRIYRLCGGSLEQISTDHVAGRRLLGKAPLTQYLGLQEEQMALEPFLVSLPIQEGCRYLLCSDGVTDMVSKEELCRILLSPKGVEEAIAELLEKTMQKGGRDNVTAILCQITKKEKRRLWPWIKGRKNLEEAREE